jgi:predicted house-cleaning noncanonical NTP pyrophosphatase (MazG superfamily)
MSRVFYNKLIRDKILDKIKDKGSECEARTISNDSEFKQELLKKVSEEARSLSMARDKEKLLDEMSDLLVVIDAICDSEGIKEDELKEAKKLNIKKKGVFVKRLFLHWSSDDGYKSNETPQGIPDKEK